MPDLVLDKLFYLMDPLSLEHVFFDGLDSYHKSGYIFNQNVVTCDQQLIFLVFLVLAALFVG